MVVRIRRMNEEVMNERKGIAIVMVVKGNMMI